ncbi:MAG TPA: hypothetical protein VIS99_08355 [Terrimicrobiaceae bacterium]
MKNEFGSSKVIPLLRALALISAVAIVACWLSLGANMGWSQTRVPVDRENLASESTLEAYEERFVPGLDFLGAGLLGAAAILALTFLVPNRRNTYRR